MGEEFDNKLQSFDKNDRVDNLEDLLDHGPAFIVTDNLRGAFNQHFGKNLGFIKLNLDSKILDVPSNDPKYSDVLLFMNFPWEKDLIFFGIFPKRGSGLPVLPFQDYEGGKQHEFDFGKDELYVSGFANIDSDISDNKSERQKLVNQFYEGANDLYVIADCPMHENAFNLVRAKISLPDEVENMIVPQNKFLYEPCDYCKKKYLHEEDLTKIPVRNIKDILSEEL